MNDLDFGDKRRGTILKHIEQLNENEHNKEKKVVEIIHCEKFLSILNNSFLIKEVREEPDFIIGNNNNSIGLELVRIMNYETKAIEGSWEKINKLIVKKYKIDYPDEIFNVYIVLNDKIKYFKKQEETHIVNTITELIHTYYLTHKLPDNKYMQRILLLPTKSFLIHISFGAFMVNTLNMDDAKETISEYINRKNKHINKYMTNSKTNRQWLLLILSGVRESSYDLPDNFKMSYSANFEKVFILNDFEAKYIELNKV
jgi:hypothetical protein